MPSSTSDSSVVSWRSFTALTWPINARGIRWEWGSNARRRSRPFGVMLTSTTRRSVSLRLRVTSPRALNWSTSRVISGSRAIVRAPISPQVKAVGWLPLRMRSTLNRPVDKLNCAFRNFSHGARRLAAVRRIASNASCSGEVKGRVCLICCAKLLAKAETIVVQTTIVKRTFRRDAAPPFGLWRCLPERLCVDWQRVFRALVGARCRRWNRWSNPILFKTD